MATRQNTGKRSKMLHTIYKDWKTNVEKNQCDCVHTRKGELEIRPSEKKRDGLLLYVCRLCEKDLCLNKIEESDLDQAIAIIDRAIDTIKMHLDLDKAKDAAIAERMAECQFRIRNQVPVPRPMLLLKITLIPVTPPGASALGSKNRLTAAA